MMKSGMGRKRINRWNEEKTKKIIGIWGLLFGSTSGYNPSSKSSR